jgi:hypothetical protein
LAACHLNGYADLIGEFLPQATRRASDEAVFPRWGNSLTHGIWLSRPGTPQFSVRGCPDILAAERQARHLIRRRTTEQLIYSEIQAAAGQDDHAWKRRTLALIETNPRQVTEPSAQELFRAAAYPEAIAAAACTRETSGRGEKGNKPAGRHEGGSGKRDLPHAT